MAEITEKKLAQKPAPSQGHKRVYQSEHTIESDLYKLELANFMRNTAIDGQKPQYEPTEHVHWFHTIDSDGKHQTLSNSIGGHFHVMEVTPGAPGEAPKVTCKSGPMRFVRTKNEYGQWVKVMEPLKADNHTHQVKYVKTSQVDRRAISSEAIKLQDQIANKEVAPAGLEVR